MCDSFLQGHCHVTKYIAYQAMPDLNYRNCMPIEMVQFCFFRLQLLESGISSISECLDNTRLMIKYLKYPKYEGVNGTDNVLNYNGNSSGLSVVLNIKCHFSHQRRESRSSFDNSSNLNSFCSFSPPVTTFRHDV